MMRSATGPAIWLDYPPAMAATGQPHQAAARDGARRSSVEGCPAVVMDGPAGVVGNLPGVAVGIDEDARVPAPEGGRPRTGDGGPREPGLGEHRVNLLGRANVVGERHPAPAAGVGDAAVPGELPAVPQRQDEPGCLEEGDVVGLVVHAPAQMPAERLVERLRPRHIADAESDKTEPLLQRCPPFLRPICCRGQVSGSSRTWLQDRRIGPRSWMMSAWSNRRGPTR